MSFQSPRRRTYNDRGHAHALTFSCFHRFPFLSAERTCAWLVESIENARAELWFALWAYVFMPEHVHLVIHPSGTVLEISRTLRSIKEPVGRRATSYIVKNVPEWLPRITHQRGSRVERHFWQRGGGYDRNVTEPKTLSSMLDYVHLNPVRRGLVERTRDWKWSSAAWFEDGSETPLVLDPIPPEWTIPAGE
jgi:REP-associated tyrosine transposase